MKACANGWMFYAMQKDVNLSGTTFEKYGTCKKV